MRTAVYPGTFDPLTNGHVDVIERSTRLFDRVIVALLVNPAKQPSFTIQERAAMIEDVFASRPGVEIDTFSGLLVDYARRRQAAAIVRGLRGVTDFDYERQMTLMNRHLTAEIDTVFLMPSAATAYISSSLVREIAALGGSLAGLVPPAVEARFERRRPSPTVKA